MISLQRPPAPASLATPEMQQYVAECAAYAAGPATAPVPAKPGNYRSSDVLRAFDEYFFSKCYLTEQWHGSSYEMDIDHFVPVNQDASLKYDWNNLFPAAHKANMMRPRTWPAGGLLNPCQDKVETRLLATIGYNGSEPRFEATDAADVAARNTAELLNLLHNGKAGDELSRQNTKHLRVTIRKRYDEVMHAILAFKDAREQGTPQQLANAQRELRGLLSRRAPFTQLMRSMRAVQSYVPADLLD
ncbi:MAG: hypothetical protein ACRYFX_20865 [Janthinobacterium lividum]